MAGTGLLAVLDDVVTLLDDIATMSKVAMKKTSGIVGDDLAVSAEQVHGLAAHREIPVIKEIAKGSLRNKLKYIVPGALILSPVIVPLLMVGGAFLCYEGWHKIAHKPEKDEHARTPKELLEHPMVARSEEEIRQIEQAKIKGAIATDFVLSAEIIAITLGAVAAKPFLTQIGVLVGMSFIMTGVVYGVVAALIRADDAGFALKNAKGEGKFADFKRKAGEKILDGAPKFMKALSVVGTAAMFMVGGGILIHGISPLHHLVQGLAQSAAAALPAVSGLASFVVEGVIGAGVGIAAGFAVERGIKLLPPAFKKKVSEAFEKSVDAVIRGEQRLAAKIRGLLPSKKAEASAPVAGATDAQRPPINASGELSPLANAAIEKRNDASGPAADQAVRYKPPSP